MSGGETDLNQLLRSLKPVARKSKHYYLTLPEDVTHLGQKDLTRLYNAALVQVKEREGLTLVVDQTGMEIAEALVPTCRPSKPLGWIVRRVRWPR